MNGLGRWMDSNLEVQGFELSDFERHWLGVRFSTGMCLALTIPALVVGSATAFAALSAIGVFAGFSSRHPFDYVWNSTVRHAFGAQPLPPSPQRRRHAFKLATAMMMSIAVLFAAGLTTAALAVGAVVVVACSAVTLMNFCIPSTLLALLERGRVQPASCSSTASDTSKLA